MEKPVIEIEQTKNNQGVLQAYAEKLNEDKAQAKRLQAYAEKLKKNN